MKNYNVFETNKPFNKHVNGWDAALLKYGDEPDGVNYLRVFSGEMEMECFP